MRAARKSYLTDLTNEQWDLLKEFIPAAKPGGRPRTVDPREIVNAIFYIGLADKSQNLDTGRDKS